MAIVKKIDSNVTSLRYAEEASFKTLPPSPNWIPLEPNSYSDFGGEITTIARNPIHSSRQRKKGVVTDLSATGGFSMDMTQKNLRDLLQGFFFADLRSKAEERVTLVEDVSELGVSYKVADTTGFHVGALIKGQGFTNAVNNSFAIVSQIDANSKIHTRRTNRAPEDPAPSAAKIVKVGHQMTAGDVNVVVSGPLPKIVCTDFDFTSLGLIVGEWIFIGGDDTKESFINAANNGFKRIRSIAAKAITFDKSELAMVAETESGGINGLKVHFYFGHFLKNELETLIKRRTYTLERTLGALDDSQPTQVQAEYIEGAVPSEVTFNIPTADKLTVDLSFVGADASTIDGPTALKAGNRPAIEEADAFNTSSDFNRIRLSKVATGEEAPTPLFAFAQDLSININNNVSPNKAVGTLGSFEITAGTFQVGGSMTAYFSDLNAVKAVRDNADITLDLILVKNKSGIILDLPLITLGDGRPNVEQDQPITLPLSMDAATAAKVDPALDYTMSMMFFDYLPNAANA